jgi:hypothetical protein
MDLFWTWGGTYFGFRQADSLLTYSGKEAGRFHGREMYASDGRYLGEVNSTDRLITNISKKSRKHGPFFPRRSGPYPPHIDHVGHVMNPGYEDFPNSNSF